MTQSESHILANTLLALGALPDVTVWRNNTGSGWTDHGRRIQFGLKGSADILGLMDGGRFLAVETKTETGRQTKEQKAFQRMIDRRGGLYIIARSPEEAVAAIEEARQA